MFGAGLVVLTVAAGGGGDATPPPRSGRTRGGPMMWRVRPARGLVERTMDGLLQAMERAVSAEAGGYASGWMQRLDPRVKLAGLVALVAAVALSQRLDVVAALLAAGVVLAAAARVPVRTMISERVAGGARLLAGARAPAVFLTPGRTVAVVPVLGWTVTAQGLTSAAYLVLRVAAASTFGFLLVFTTRWPHVLKALRAFRVPVVFVVVLGDDLPLHPAAARVGARHVRRAPQPDGRSSDGRRPAPRGHGQRGRAAREEPDR